MRSGECVLAGGVDFVAAAGEEVVRRDVADGAVKPHAVVVRDESGDDGASLVAAEKSPRVQELYRTYGDEALALGVFGAPTFVLDGTYAVQGEDELKGWQLAVEAAYTIRPSPTHACAAEHIGQCSPEV